MQQSEILQIAKLHIAKLTQMLVTQGFALLVTDNALDRIAELGYDVQYGARPLKRAIQKYLIDKLLMKLIALEYQNGDTIEIDVDENGFFVFHTRKNSTSIVKSNE